MTGQRKGRLGRRQVAGMPVVPMRECVECKRVFDLRDETDAQEWFYGHDCEVKDERS